MEITTILAVRELVAVSQRAAAMVSEPGRGRRTVRVVLGRVERSTLRYEVRVARRQIRVVTVRFAQEPGITRVSIEGVLDGAAAVFAGQLLERIHAADAGATCSRAGAGAQAG
jgi:hypothetical protein